MRDFKVIDKDGEWLVNTSPFRLAHTRSETDIVVLESGVPTKIVHDEWLKGQSTVVVCPDPMSDEPIPGVMVASENTVIPSDEHGDPDLGSAPGVLGTTAETTVTGEKPTGSKRK